jgi:hypothetical protein
VCAKGECRLALLAGANKASLKICWQFLIFSKSKIAAFFGILGDSPKCNLILCLYFWATAQK